MANSWVDYVPWVYFSIQSTMSITVSIIGASYVRQAFLTQKAAKNQTATKSDQTPDETKETEDIKIEIELHEYLEKPKARQMSFFWLWLKIVWKMRSVYGSMAVHAFDVLTDVLVIISWWDYEKIYGDVPNINARTMALCGIIVLLFHKFISVIAFWAKEASFKRCCLQFFDLLIFEEIYACHKKVVQQIKSVALIKDKKSQTDKRNEAVETTTTFKLYIY